MRTMINLTESPEFKENTLATIAVLYPLAFAKAAISDSRTGRALQRWRAADLNPACDAADGALEATRAFR